MTEYTQPDIDLRPYIHSVLKNWYWIIGLGLLAGVLAYLGTRLLLTPTYEATSLVSLNVLRQRVEFDPRIVTEELVQPPKAYLEIALSDDILARVREETPAVSSLTLGRIRSFYDVEQGNDQTIIRVTASNAEPALAAELANNLASQLVLWANNKQDETSEQQLDFFEQRLAAESANIEQLEQALIDFQAENRLTLLQNEFDSLQQTHAELLEKQANVEDLTLDIDSLLASIQSSDGAALSGEDRLTALILRLRTFGGSTSMETSVPPWQLQVNSNESVGESVTTLAEEVSQLRLALEAQTQEIQSALAEIEPRLLDVQRERQEASTIESQLQREIDLAVETQQALARTVDEKRITSQNSSINASVASRSQVPASPTGPRALFNALAAFAGVALLVTFVIVLTTWWRLSNDVPERRDVSGVDGGQVVMADGKR